MGNTFRQTIPVSGVAPPRGHYSHALRTNGGSLLFVAGQVPLDENGDLVAAGDIEAQAHQVFENLQRVVEAGGASLASVIKTTVYITDLSYRSALDTVRREHFEEPPPVNTLLVVSNLADPAFLVEVEAIAVAI